MHTGLPTIVAANVTDCVLAVYRMAFVRGSVRGLFDKQVYK